MKAFVIQNTRTGLYHVGHYNHWNKDHGKLYSTIGHARAAAKHHYMKGTETEIIEFDLSIVKVHGLNGDSK